MAGQRPSPPVHADVREEPVLDLVPLAGAGRQGADRDGQAGLPGEAPELVLPSPDPVAIAPATVGADQELIGIGVGHHPIPTPPASQALDREGRRFLVLADVAQPTLRSTS